MSVDHILIAVPARDEEATLADCLRSLERARAAVPVRSSVVLVLDSCTDGSLDVARRFPDSLVIEREHENVGRSRHDAVLTGLRACGSSPDRTWIAFTDADSTVPRPWLREHLRAARTADAYVGAVVPRLAELDEPRRRAWQRSHPPGATLGHVHGANLGVRADAYLRVGGFLPLLVGEDVDLVARLRDARFRIAESERHPVTTSGRLSGRAPEGYSAYLRGLAT
ncbi:glycosyltransferase family 2 protein [Leifsonia sp. EB34]|uniref:glycosyltransferase n=1 Tax=Leifsonia sp. EB34 TaxID=3156303 RepID=UPI00351997F3